MDRIKAYVTNNLTRLKAAPDTGKPLSKSYLFFFGQHHSPGQDPEDPFWNPTDDPGNPGKEKPTTGGPPSITSISGMPKSSGTCLNVAARTEIAAVGDTTTRYGLYLRKDFPMAGTYTTIRQHINNSSGVYDAIDLQY